MIEFYIELVEDESNRETRPYYSDAKHLELTPTERPTPDAASVMIAPGLVLEMEEGIDMLYVEAVHPLEDFAE